MLIYRNIYWNLPPTQAINHIFNGAKLNTLVQEVWSMCNLICSWKHWVLLFTGIHKIIIVKLYKYCLSPVTKSVVFVYMFERLCMKIHISCSCICVHIYMPLWVYTRSCGCVLRMCCCVCTFLWSIQASLCERTCLCLRVHVCIHMCEWVSSVFLNIPPPTSWNQFSHWVWNSLILLGWLASDA